jgi:ribosomal protein S18 acetylase RimI-like enzyme
VRAPSLSTQLWSLDWTRILPFQFDDVSVEIATFADAAPFIEEHYPKFFAHEDDGVKFLREPMTEAKRRFSELSDVFLFRDGEKKVGVMISHPTDWSTYYLRSSAFLPEYRNRHLLTRFTEALFAPLAAAGVARMETETAPSNLAVQRVMVTCGWVITGTTNSERWGTLLRATKFLSDEARAAFSHQFCLTPR